MRCPGAQEESKTGEDGKDDEAGVRKPAERDGGVDLSVEKGGWLVSIAVSDDVLEGEGPEGVEEQRKGSVFAGVLVEDPEHLLGEVGAEGVRVKTEEGAIDATGEGFHVRLGLGWRSRDRPSRTTF